MSEFRSLIEDFNATLDALRDFVASVGPVLTQRGEKSASDASTLFARFHIASILADDTIETSHIDDEFKEILSRTRKILTSVDTGVPIEKVKTTQDKIREVIPIKIVENKIELDFDNPEAPDLIAHHKAIQKVKREIGLLHESALMALTSRGELFLAS